MVEPNQKRRAMRGLLTLALGLVLGGLLTELSGRFLPESAARSFLTTGVSASVGPFSIELVAVGVTVGPVSFYVNVLTLVGIAIVAFVVRSWM